MKLDPATLRAFGALCAILGPSEKLNKRAWTMGWGTNVSVAHAVQVYRGGLARLAHWGGVFEF